MSTRKNSVKLIEQNDYCVSCGACTHVCPFNNIRMEYNGFRGKWDAVVRNPHICSGCDGEANCLSVCPAYDVDYMKLAASEENGLLGRIVHVYNGYSEDGRTRVNSSSGGFVRSVCRELLDKQTVQGVISLCHWGGLEYGPEVITDVSRMPNSIYHNVNFQKALKLLGESKEKVLIVGLPCQITSIKQYLNRKKNVPLRDRIYATISLICGYVFDRVNIEAFARYNHLGLEAISYREGGRYRKTRVFDGDKSVLFDVFNPSSMKDIINNMLMFDRFLTQNHCLYCVDHIGYCADIAVGDAWQKRYADDRIGTNIIIARTERGDQIVRELDGFHLETGFPEEIIASQGREYALGSIGESMKSIKLKDRSFYPNHKRTECWDDIVRNRIKFRDVIKIKVVKKLMRNRHFTMAKLLYTFLESDTILKSLVLRWL